MGKMMLVRSLFRSTSLRSSSRLSVAAHQQRHHHYGGAFNLSSPYSPKTLFVDRRLPSALSIGSTRYFTADVAHLPEIKDPEIKIAFKKLMATNWNELPDSVVSSAKKALSKPIDDDKASQEILANVLRAAEAVEEFSGKILSLKMELDDSVGMSGEDVHLVSEEISNALNVFYQRYANYLDAFGPDETYLRKKVESELGAHMIYLKMRCSGLSSDWGKITVLGTSGISGSYVEQRA